MCRWVRLVLKNETIRKILEKQNLLQLVHIVLLKERLKSSIVVALTALQEIDETMKC